MKVFRKNTCGLCSRRGSSPKQGCLACSIDVPSAHYKAPQEDGIQREFRIGMQHMVTLFVNQHKHTFPGDFLAHWNGAMPRAWLAQRLGMSVEGLCKKYGIAKDVRELQTNHWILPE